MKLEEISILNFKNIAEAELKFSPKVNCLLGSNGMGKSNLLEAVHFLSFTRSMSSLPEAGLIRHGQDMMLVKGKYVMHEAQVDEDPRHEVSCGIVRGKSKVLKVDGKDCKRISEHVGRFPIVTVSPADSVIVTGSAEQRRKLMDMTISQADGSYMKQLIRYTKALESRNRMLRAGINDALLYESVEETMTQAALAIAEKRAQWIADLRDGFAHYYSSISGDAETASMAYVSSVYNSDYRQVLDQSRAKDRLLGFTTKGVHRDDIEMLMGDYSMRALGSQGQVKTYTIALRFAIFDYLRSKKGETPILLLDDIFDKLDAQRVGRIMGVVSSSDFGQIFITDTNRKHLDEILDKTGGDRLMIEVTDGRFSYIAQ